MSTNLGGMGAPQGFPPCEGLLSFLKLDNVYKSTSSEQGFSCHISALVAPDELFHSVFVSPVAVG